MVCRKCYSTVPDCAVMITRTRLACIEVSLPSGFLYIFQLYRKHLQTCCKAFAKI